MTTSAPCAYWSKVRAHLKELNKYIKVRFLWLKDLIDEGEIILKYVPSEELVVDMLTKATTGAKFKYLRDKLLGTKGEDTA